MIEKVRMNTTKLHITVQVLSVLVVMLFAVNTATSAQDPVFEFQAPSAVVYYPVGSPESETFTGVVSIEQTVTPGGGTEDPASTQGYSLGLAHDQSLLSINSGTSMVVSSDGVEASFDSINIYPEGLTHGVVYSFTGVWVLSYEVPTPVLEIEYQLLSGSLTGAGSATSTDLQFTDTIPIPPSPEAPVATVIVVDGASLAVTEVTGTLTLTPYEGSQFIRGDVTQNGSLDIADGIGVLSFLFVGGSTTCYNSLDADDTGNVSISDAVRILCAVFCPGSPPPAGPFPGCGVDLVDDAGSCDQYSGCP